MYFATNYYGQRKKNRHEKSIRKRFAEPRHEYQTKLKSSSNTDAGYLDYLKETQETENKKMAKFQKILLNLKMEKVKIILLL